MAKTSLVNYIHHVDASLCVESIVLVSIVEPAVKNTVGMLELSLKYLTDDLKKCIKPVMGCFL